MRLFDWHIFNSDLPLSKRERREIRRSAWKLWMRDWRHATIYLTIVILLTGIAAAIGWYGPDKFWFWQVAILLAIYTGLWVIVFSILLRVSVAPVARRLLRERGFDLCIRCGYWLCGLNDDVIKCPECGRRRDEEDAQQTA